MEPLLIGSTYRFRGCVADLAFDLAQKSASFRRSYLPVSWPRWPILCDR